MDRSPRRGRHSIGSVEYASPPVAVVPPMGLSSPQRTLPLPAARAAAGGKWPFCLTP
jgi:hypothetical protein